jgi:hypothetical protein
MRPESVEIKVTVSEQVPAAVEALHLVGTVAGNDLLEVAVVTDPDAALAQQAALDDFVARRGPVRDESQENKTQRILAALVAQGRGA